MAGPPSPITHWRRLFDLVSLESRDLQIVLGYGLGVGLLSLATPVAVQALIDFVAFGGLLQPIVVLAVLLALVLGFVAMLKAAQTLVVEMISRRIFLRTARRVAARVTRPGEGINLVKLTNRFLDVVTVEKSSAILLFDGITVVLQILAGMALLAVYHPILLAFDAIVALLVALLVVVPGRSAIRSAMDESSAKFAMADWLEELALHPAVFHSARGERVAEQRTFERMELWLAARRRHFSRVFLQTVGFLALQVLVMTLLLGLGGWLVVQRELAVGQLVAAELVMAATVASVARLGKLLQKGYDLLAALQKIGSVTDGEPASTQRDRLPEDPSGIALAAFGEGVELRVAAGEKVRLVGAEGGGKTRLLERIAWLVGDETVVELDGIDARMIDVRCARDLIHLLGEGGIVEASIEDNLRVARPDATAPELSAVLARVGLADAVRALPSGAHTLLEPDGAPLSGTQAKRLLIARVLLANPRLVLVDRFLDDLPDGPLAQIADALLSDDAPWTVVCVSDDPRVLPHLQREVPLSSADADADAAGDNDATEGEGAT